MSMARMGVYIRFFDWKFSLNMHQIWVVRLNETQGLSHFCAQHEDNLTPISYVYRVRGIVYSIGQSSEIWCNLGRWFMVYQTKYVNYARFNVLDDNHQPLFVFFTNLMKPQPLERTHQTKCINTAEKSSKALTLIRANFPVVCVQWLKNCNHCLGIHWVPSVTLRWTSVSVKHIRFSAIIEAGRCPWDPCMVYLPTFTIKDKPSVGEYTIHGWNGM